MRVFLFLLLLSVSNVWAQLQTEQAVSMELKARSVSAAKPFLLYQATHEALKRYATELNLNVDELDKNLRKKFEVYFENFKQRKLAAKFGKNFSKDLSAAQKEEFLKGLEEHREAEYIKFSRLIGILDGHAFKQIGQDPKTPALWQANIFLEINRGKLDQLVKRASSNQTKQYAKLNLITNINLFGFSWNDLGLEKESSFIEPIASSWMKWLVSNQPVNVEEINYCTGLCLSGFERWLQLPQDEGLEIEADQVNDLWLQVSLNLKKLFYHSNLNEWQFEWEGRVVLLDANTKRVLTSVEIHPERKTLRGTEQKEINSMLASHLYRSPLAAFTTTTKKVVELPQLNRLSRLVIQGQSHLGDVLSLMSLLKKEGHNLNLELQLDLFTQKEAQLLCFYQGEEKSFSDLLSRLKELKSSHSYRLVNEFTGIHHKLQLIAE